VGRLGLLATRNSVFFLKHPILRSRYTDQKLNIDEKIK